MPIFIAIVAVAIVGGGFFFFSNNANKDTQATLPTPTPITQPQPSPVAPSPVTAKKKYFDGEYSADATYTIPNGELEKITVSLTIKDGIVTAADFTGNPVEAGSKFNQGKFREGFKELVVGKDIDSVNLTVVNGSSLTPKGFMTAISAIKTDAQTKA